MRHVLLLASVLSLVAVAAPVRPAGQVPGGLVVRDAWVREAAAGAASTAAYLTIENRSARDAALLSIESPAARVVELHRMRMTADQRMHMEPVVSVPVSAGVSVALAPGGYHAMLFDLSGARDVGDAVDLVLHFDNGETVQVTAEVLPRATVGR